MAGVAVVTGGTRGIGAAVSRALAARGETVIATFVRDSGRAEAFAAESGVRILRWDVTDADACSRHVAAVEAEHGAIAILVNNAGITRDASFAKMDRAKWDAVIDTNLGGCFNMTHAVWPGMVARRYGRIVNIGSINGQAGQFGQANYAAAKAALQGFTKALALEGARSGITVNAIAPGYIKTDMVAAVPPEALAKIVARIPVGRLGEPEEIARAVMFLSDDGAGFVTGSTLTVNGGQYMI